MFYSLDQEKVAMQIQNKDRHGNFEINLLYMEVDASENCVCLWHFCMICFLIKCFITLLTFLQNVLSSQILHNIINISIKCAL